MGSFKDFLVNNFSFLGRYKRWGVVVKDTLTPVKKSYSQYGEDEFIASKLENYNLRDAMYVDIGANHPTDISNTYLLYRKGQRGVVIEPNQELIGLFKKFRKRDIALGIGCSNKSTILKFNISKTPVLSSFSNDRGIILDKQVYLPVMTLDQALENIEFQVISLLSIDVEGLNREVLEGATTSLKKTLIVCIEFDTSEEKKGFETILNNDFELIHTVKCNLIYLNKELSAKLKKKETFK